MVVWSWCCSWLYSHVGFEYGGEGGEVGEVRRGEVGGLTRAGRD